jgi:hypothetical protein
LLLLGLQVSDAFLQSVSSQVRYAKKPRKDQNEQEASPSKGETQDRSGTEQSLDASCGQDDEDDLLPDVNASEEGRGPVHTPSSAGKLNLLQIFDLGDL